MRTQCQAERERATATEGKALQLEARIVDLKAELDRVLKQMESEQHAAQAAREEAKTAVIETARLNRDGASLRLASVPLTKMVDTGHLSRPKTKSGRPGISPANRKLRGAAGSVHLRLPLQGGQLPSQARGLDHGSLGLLASRLRRMLPRLHLFEHPIKLGLEIEDSGFEL